MTKCNEVFAHKWYISINNKKQKDNTNNYTKQSYKNNK